MSAGNYYAMTHQIAPNGGGTKVNEWTLMMDIQVPIILKFNSMFQTDPTNSDDGDCFVAADGSVGVGETGYSAVAITALEWHRMVVEHVDMNVAELRMYDHALTSTEVNELGGFPHATSIRPIGPYLQNVTTTGITIMWESTEPTPDTIEYGLTTAYDSQQIATMQAMRDGMWLHKAVLTGLTGATTYHYRLVTPDDNAPDRTFKTAPLPTASFTFAVWGDSQGTTDENLIDPLEPTKAFMHHLAEVVKVDLAVAVGDMAERGDNTPSVRRYFLDRAADIVGSQLPFYIAWGNHDGPEGSIIRSYVDLPGPRSYSFDYGGAHFICVDYYDTQKDITDFVKADLQSPAAAQARFIFFFIHTAPYYERWYEGEKWLRSKIVPLLEKHQVAISFSGHMHGYERGLLNGVHYVTTGGGSWLDSFEPLVRDWPHITIGGFSSPPPSAINNGIVNEYVKVEITGDVAKVTTFGFTPDGRLLGEIDGFTVTSP